MAATIQVNGSTATHVVVPFGATVTLLNAAPAGTAQQWLMGDYPSDFNDVSPDFAANFASWTVQGDGSLLINQASGPFAAVTFKPDVTGAYMLKLGSFESGAWIYGTCVVEVVEVFSGERLTAAGEGRENDARVGWHAKDRRKQKRTVRFLQGCIRAANTSGGSLARGVVRRISGVVDAHTIGSNVNPGGTTAATPENLPTLGAGDSTVLNGRFVVLEETIADGAVGWVRVFGLFEGKSDVNFTGYTAGQRVYFDATGVMTKDATDSAVSIGTLLVTGSTGKLWVDGAAGSVPNAGIGPAVAAAANLDAGSSRLVPITGTTTINAMVGVIPGAEKQLYFESALELGHMVGSPPSGSAPFELPFASNYGTSPGETLTFKLFGGAYFGTPRWRYMGSVAL